MTPKAERGKQMWARSFEVGKKGKAKYVLPSSAELWIALGATAVRWKKLAGSTL